MRAPVQLRRDPFGRRTLMRQMVANEPGAGSCNWCGKRHARLYRYGWQPDSIRGGINWLGGAFCSVDCANAKHDGI